MGNWIWLSIAVIIILAELIGGLKQIGSPLFWLGRAIAIMWWKHKKTWPVKLEYMDRPRCSWFSVFLDIYVELMIKVRERNSRSKIDSITVKLISNEHSCEGNEYTPVEPPPELPGLTNLPLSQLRDGKYSLTFRVYAVPDYFKQWYEGKIASNVYGVVKLEAGGLSSETKPQVVKK